MNEYDDLIANPSQPAPGQSARVGFSVALDANPDEYAEARRVAQRTGVPVDTALNMPKEIKKRARMGEIDFDSMAVTSPATAKLLADIDLAKMSHDDVDNLTGFEQAAKTLKNYGGAIGEGFIGQGVGTLFSGAGRLYDITARQLAKPIIAIGGDTAKDFLEAPISPYLDPSLMLLKNPGEAFKAIGKSMAPGESDRTFGTDVAGGLGQLGGQALVQYLTGGTVSSLSLLAQGTDIVGEKVAKDNASQDAKDAAMLGGGLVTSITEKYALDKILGPLAVPVKNAIAASLARIGIAAAAEGGQEIAENIGHDALRKLLTNQDAKIDLPGAAYEGGVGATVGGIARGVIEAALHVRVRGAQREQEAQQAGQMGELLTGMTKLAEASKLRERDVETAQGFFQSALDEGRDSVFITPEALAQSGLAEQIAQAIPAVAEQMQTASETGHDIRLPIAELMATMAGPELAQSIIPHVAVDPGGFTPTTAQEYMQSDKAAELQAEVEKILGEKQVDDTFKASAEIVKSRIISELTATTRWDKAKNEADATIYAAYYAVRAAQMGITPEEHYDQRRVNFSDTMIAGDQFDQSEVQVDGVARPTTDASGRPLHYTEAGIQNFWRWFDGVGRKRLDSESEAGQDGSGVDQLNRGNPERFALESSGRPRNFYHGTADNFDSFDLNHPNRKDTGWLGRGVYLTSSSDLAETYSNLKAGSGNPVTMPLYAAVHTPLVVPLEKKQQLSRLSQAGIDAWTDQVKAAGYDGVALTFGDGTIELVAFEPEQVKSAIGNNGQFDANDPNILHQQNLGKFSPDKLTVTMLQGANFTTTLHEGAHFFFENDIFLASKILADADIHGYDTLSVGEKQILLDVSKLMDWHGIQGDITEQLRQWSNMDFEEKRTYHERTAESFERYLFEGKAPSIELQPYFQRFAAWWKRVYTSMKEFLAKNPEAGKLNPEVSAIFDRMLATTEQIQLAEQGRSMMPLFRTQAEAANIGMTPAEFEAYQHQDVDATNTAIEQLQARGLRDMQWIHNARGRVIKQLQKESAAKRAEVQMEARAEIMSQPIYRAWTFLTSRLTSDDKVKAEKPTRSDPPSVLDETLDSLFVAIAKLGGVNKAEIISSWGVDPADKPTSGVFGKPLWRVDGGLSIDGMAEALIQYGYLEQDENGKWDIRELEDKFKAELGGDTQFSNAYDYAANQAPGKAGEEVANPDAVQAGRLSRDALADMGLPVELINHLVALKMVAKEGWHPDLIAERFEFSSGDDMVRRIAAAESPKDAINGLTDQRMLERFGDLSSQEAIDKAADKAIHNEVRARMMATELNALENALGKRKTLASAAKEYATAMIGRVKVRDLKPGQYASAEARALKAAQAASKSGDIAKAAAEQRNALINNYATRAAHDAQDSIEKLRRDMASLANRSDDKLKKSYDMDLINAVRAILGEYGIAEKKANRAIDYLEVFKQNDPDMYAVISDAVENASRNAKPYKELTVEDARALGEEVAAILHLAKRSRQMEVDGDMIDRQEVEDALRARLAALGIPESMPGDGSAITAGEVAMQKFRTALAALTRVESWVGKMDGADTFGPFRRYVFGRVKNAADAYRSDKAKYLKQFSELFDSIKPTLKPAIIAAPELGYTFGKDAGGSAINEIVHAILHTGNASNKRKLLLGRNWAQERPDGSLDTSRWDAFIQRMANEGKITKAHFDFAQGVWDLLESTKPLAQKTHRDVFGKYFDEVTAEQLNSPFGLYAGGYVPAMADSRIVADANMRALSEVENQSMQFAFPTTAKGFTKGRVEYNAPLMLDLRTLSQHIDKVLMFSHLEMPVRDVQRVMKGIGGTLNKVDPAAIPGLITPWLNRAAKQQVVTPISNDAGTSRFLSVMRSRAGAAAMFGNLANAVQQITGFSLASLKVRPSLMLSATADFAKHPKVFVAGVSEASPYMAERLDSEVAAMNDNINQILLNPSLLEKGQAWSMRHAYFLQTAIDSAMSPIIWTAAYNQALEQGHSHDDAVRLGDSAVRETQGSTLPEDISRIESGNAFVRLFTQFAGYFNMQANLLGTEYAKMIQQDCGLRKNASKGLFIFMMGFYVPAVVGELVMQLFKGGPGDDDKDGEYLDDWLAVLFGMAPLRTAMAMVPVAGQAINSAINAWNSKPYDDRIASSPAISMLESAAKSPVSVYNAVVSGGSAQKAVRDVATLISMTVGIPVNLAARPIGYAVGVADNKINPTSGPDMARGLVTGIASPDSKR